MAGKIDPAVQKCIGALQAASNDTEKMAALFLVTKVVKGPKMNRDSKLALFNAIGFKFLIRLLKNQSTPDCPAILYKSVALSVLTAFCSEPSIASSPEMLEAIPIFLEIIESADETNEDDDQLLMVVSEAYHCLKCLASVKKGRLALVKSGAIKRLCQIYSKGMFNSEEALEVIKGVAVGVGSRTWDGNPDAFNELMDKISLQFEADQSEQKFELAGLMASIMASYNMSKEAIETAFWPRSILKGLVDILTSKITAKQRNPALKLASAMITTLGVDWLFRCADSSEEGSASQFFVLLVHLSTIEVRMSLEDRKLPEIMADDELIVACYGILETIVRFLSGNHAELIDDSMKEQIFQSLKGAYTAILGFINLVRKEAEKNPRKFWDAKKKLLACASVRCLAAWLAEDSASLKEEIYKQLPFVLALVFEAFQDAEDEQSPESQVLLEEGRCCEGLLPPILCQLLPSLCRLTSEERGVRMLLDAEVTEMLFRFLNHNWQAYKNLRELLERKSRPGKPGKKFVLKEGEPDSTVEEIRENLEQLRAAIMHTANLFINMSILDPESINEDAVFGKVMRWAVGALPNLTDAKTELVLASNVSTLGLLLLRHSVKRSTDAQKEGKPLPPEEQFATSRIISGADNAVFKFGESVIRFVWNAHLPDETQSPTVLGLTSEYRAVWSDVKEMWFMSLQSLGALLELLPWLGDFAAESGFLEALIKNVSAVYKSLIDSNTLQAYEEFFCCAARSSPNAVNIMKTKGAALAASHHLRTLTKVLKGEEVRK